MSARSMMMVFARGMSRPLSMIAVATSTSYSPATKSSMVCSSVSSSSLPVGDGDARARHERLQARRALVDALDAVVDVEHLAAARELLLDGVRDERRIELARDACGSRGDRPAASRSSDRSRRPPTASWSVRGIGVALSVSTSTFERSCLMRSLCVTPKRCSSSTTSRPRFL